MWFWQQAWTLNNGTDPSIVVYLLPRCLSSLKLFFLTLTTWYIKLKYVSKSTLTVPGTFNREEKCGLCAHLSCTVVFLFVYTEMGR